MAMFYVANCERLPEGTLLTQDIHHLLAYLLISLINTCVGQFRG